LLRTETIPFKRWYFYVLYYTMYSILQLMTYFLFLIQLQINNVQGSSQLCRHTFSALYPHFALLKDQRKINFTKNVLCHKQLLHGDAVRRVVNTHFPFLLWNKQIGIAKSCDYWQWLRYYCKTIWSFWLNGKKYHKHLGMKSETNLFKRGTVGALTEGTE
jgi:hypothetical protein